MSARRPDQEERLLKVVAPGAVGVARLVAHAALVRAAEVTPPTTGMLASDAAVLETFWAFARAIPPPLEAPPAEPDCTCGEPAALHVWSEWAQTRPCNEAEEKCGCFSYTPASPLRETGGEGVRSSPLRVLSVGRTGGEAFPGSAPPTPTPPKETEAACNCGNPGCGGCYPSCHGGTDE